MRVNLFQRWLSLVAYVLLSESRRLGLAENFCQYFQLDRQLVIGYTNSMKTAISLPNEVFKEAERFARKSHKSRSQLYAEALAEYLARHASNDITESMNAVCDQLGPEDDKFTHAAARIIFDKESW